MTVGPNITARGYSVVTDPGRFTNYPLRRNHPNTLPELLLFTNQSNSSGSTVYSEAICVAPASGFTISVNDDASGNVIIETSVNPDLAVWNVLTTIAGGGTYSNADKLNFIRVGLANGVSGATVWAFRRYETY